MNTSFFSWRKLMEFGIAAIVISTLTLAGCGGGGGGSSSPAATGYTVTGQLTGQTGAVSGVTVVLDGPYTTTTNASGIYTFTGVAAGNYTLYPSAVGYTYTPLTQAVSVTGNTSAPSTFSGTPSAGSTYSVSGTVSNLSTNTTALLTFTTSASTVPYATAYTGANGAYSLGNLPTNSYTITPSATGYTFSPASAVASVTTANVTQNFTATLIPQPHKITGTITNDPGGVTITVTCSSNCPVGFTPVTTTSSGGTNGTYTVSGLLSGNYTVTPSKTNYTFSPLSASVTMSGQADATATTFTATSDTSVKAQISGTVSGPWAGNVTVALGGYSTTTTHTDANGNYSFSNVSSGESYTVTPSLPGYNFASASGVPANVSITGGSSATVTVPVFTETAAVASYKITGNITYSGINTGPVYIQIPDLNSMGAGIVALSGTSGNYSSSYSIRGNNSSQSVTVSAFMDTLGTGVQTATSPSGSATVTLNSNGDTTGVNIALTDPSHFTPAAVNSLVAFGMNSGAAVTWSVNGLEQADHYKVEWSTSSSFSSITGSRTVVANGSDVVFLSSASGDTGISNGNTYYFRVTPYAFGAPGTPAVTSSVTIGAVSSGSGKYTISGTITIPGSISGPVYIGVHNNSVGAFGQVIASPSGSTNFSVTGVPPGTYQAFILLDQNTNGIPDTGDLGLGLGGNNQINTQITVTNANLTNQTPQLQSGNSLPAVNTEFGTDGSSTWYNEILTLTPNAKMPVAATLVSATTSGIALPMDLGSCNQCGSSGIQSWIYNSGTPQPGDQYVYYVTYSDGTSEYLTTSVTGVLSNGQLATNTSPSGTVSASYETNPTLSWSAPSSPPSQYGYTNIYISTPNGGSNVWNYSGHGGPLSSSTTNVSTSVSLTPATQYQWGISVIDGDGNMATRVTPFTPQ